MTLIGVPKEIAEDTELASHLCHNDLASQAFVKKGSNVPNCKFWGHVGWGQQSLAPCSTAGCPSNCSLCVADRSIKSDRDIASSP